MIVPNKLPRRGELVSILDGLWETPSHIIAYAGSEQVAIRRRGTFGKDTLEYRSMAAFRSEYNWHPDHQLTGAWLKKIETAKREG